MKDKPKPIIPFFWIYLVVGVMGIVVSGMISYSFYIGARMNTRHIAQLAASKDIRLDVTTAHLWFEEILSNDEHEEMGEVWSHLDHADQQIKALLTMEESETRSFLSFDNPKMYQGIIGLRKKLLDFKKVTQKRSSEKETSGSGSDIDQHHDAIFLSLTEQAAEVETEIQGTIENALVRFKLIHTLLIAGCLLLSILGWLVVRRFQILQMKHFHTLQESNELLQKEVIERKKAEEATKVSRKNLRVLNSRIQSIREEEKTLIAREMHDELGHSLCVINLDLIWIKNRLPENAQLVRNKIDSMFPFIESIVRTVQKIVTQLRPEILDAYGLLKALQWQTTEFRDRTGLQCELVCPNHIDLDSDRSIMFFRIYQETLTNIVRHAKASKVEAYFKINKNSLELLVSDDGVGIEKNHIFGEKSFGLMGMRERALSWGGKVTFHGEKGKGTTVSVNVPIKVHENDQSQNN